jgi:hypothetical protein
VWSQNGDTMSLGLGGLFQLLKEAPFHTILTSSNERKSVTLSIIALLLAGRIDVEYRGVPSWTQKWGLILGSSPMSRPIGVRVRRSDCRMEGTGPTSLSPPAVLAMAI